MRNEVIFDDRGRPDILVVFTPDELKLPDTLKGRKVKEYAISKYPNTMIDGRPYSLPFMPPAVNINHDEAIRLCEAKGPGWHLITNDEWAALARQSWENDTVPTGNTNGGESHSHPEEKGTTYKDCYGKTLAGSGPITWNHDRTAEGVADMVGNVWEHVGGVRFLDGQVQIIPNNEAAAGADQSPDSKEWTAIYTPDGDPVYYEVWDGEIRLQPTAPDVKDSDGVPFCDLHERADMDVPDKLIELGLYPAPGYESEEYFWLDTDGERCVFRGGRWGHGTGAGVFSLIGDYSRSSVCAGVGFRSALVRYSGDSDDLDHLDDDPTDTGDKTESWPFPLPDTLPGVVKLMLTKVLTEIYTAAGGKDLLTFKKMAYNASDNEIMETVRIASQLAQLNISANAMRQAIEQTKLAMTTSITIKKEGDHE
nr:MAG TPA: TREPONEMA DENTICOLA VARIABLE PROTEIN 1 FUNCTION, PERIODONTAL DISEASE [Caudoviricetes sp.]